MAWFGSFAAEFYKILIMVPCRDDITNVGPTSLSNVLCDIRRACWSCWCAELPCKRKQQLVIAVCLWAAEMGRQLSSSRVSPSPLRGVNVGHLHNNMMYVYVLTMYCHLWLCCLAVSAATSSSSSCPACGNVWPRCPEAYSVSFYVYLKREIENVSKRY